MDVSRVAEITVVMVGPSLVLAAVLYAPGVVRTVRRLGPHRPPVPVAGPPIEQLAADLRRLLVCHEELTRSTSTAMRVVHLRAVEAAITDCAADAARALDVPCPPRPARGGLPV